LKPANILISRTPPVAKLGDFGLARWIAGNVKKNEASKQDQESDERFRSELMTMLQRGGKSSSTTNMMNEGSKDSQRWDSQKEDVERIFESYFGESRTGGLSQGVGTALYVAPEVWKVTKELHE